MQRPNLNSGLSDLKADKEHEVLSALRGIKFGSIEVIIHDSEIVQIIRTEKQRIGNRANSE